MDISELRIYRDLLLIAEEYHKKHEAIIRNQIYEELKDTIKKQLPALLIDNLNMVWCMDANVCLKAEPCCVHTCLFKKRTDDIPNGPASCQLFQVATASITFEDSIPVSCPWENE